MILGFVRMDDKLNCIPRMSGDDPCYGENKT